MGFYGVTISVKWRHNFRLSNFQGLSKAVEYYVEGHALNLKQLVLQAIARSYL